MYQMPCVYLAGGMHNQWRGAVRSAFNKAIYLDPSSHGLEDEEDYTSWDLSAIVASDIVFAYLDKDNPSGYGMMLEIGYGFARGKIIIFVNEKEDMDRYCGMARQLAGEGYFSSLEDGLDYLKTLLTLYSNLET